MSSMDREIFILVSAVSLSESTLISLTYRTPGRLLHNRRFDFAMVAFLECLKQITDWAKAQDTSLEFPYAYALLLPDYASIRLTTSAVSSKIGLETVASSYNSARKKHGHAPCAMSCSY